MPVTSGSHVLAEMIKGYGATHVFLVPAIFHAAIAEMDDLGIVRVITHSELSAAYMADGYARASHRPGICLAQTVGAANLAAGLRDAYLACSPVVALTGGPHPDFRYRHPYQQIEDLPMFDPVTKFNVRVEKVERLPDLLRQAFRAATTGTPGPVHVEVAGRVGEVIRTDCDVEVIVEEAFGHYPVYRHEPEPRLVQDAARLLAVAERPVIVAGGGATTSGAGPELVELAERLSIPVAYSLNGKGLMPDDHPLCLGLAGSYGRWCANQALAEADLVFFVGSRAGGLVTDEWKAPRPGTPTIQLDVDPAEIGRNYPIRAALPGDAKLTLQRLLDVAEPATPHDEWLRCCQSLAGEWRSALEPMACSDAEPIRPERICRELTDFLPPGAVLVSDTGYAAQWTGNMVDVSRPGQRYIRCAGTLGWGLPGAMGVKCALPNVPVLCFIGDGGLYYHLAELETAARLGINVVVLVNDNGALGQTKPGLEAGYGGKLRGRSDEMWVFRRTSFAEVAESLGCLGLRVERAEELRGALERAFAADRPALLDVVSDVDARPPRAWR